jgi:hypothetical protein
VISHRVTAELSCFIKAADGEEAAAENLNGENSMVDFLLGFAFVAMILSPAIVASLQRGRSHDSDN